MRPFDPASALGPRLREVREERGLAVRELARRIGCSASLISQVERGISSPSAGMLTPWPPSCRPPWTICSM